MPMMVPREELWYRTCMELWYRTMMRSAVGVTDEVKSEEVLHRGEALVRNVIEQNDRQDPTYLDNNVCR